MAPFIEIRGASYTYYPHAENPPLALDGIDLEIGAGEYMAIVGHNGSGKSTLAKHLNALLLPTSGSVLVNGHDTRAPEHRRAIREAVGMVFQVPDNQIVATIVEEDVAFGPENLGVPHDEIVSRVEWALNLVEMAELRRRAPHLLSAGQKQRVAIAGVMAMRPACLVLDEATSMLDPAGREEVLASIERLHREAGTAVVAITHFMEEAARAQRVVVMETGKIVLQGTPREVFSQPERLRELQLDVPVATDLARRLHRRLPQFPPDVIAAEELVEAVLARFEPERAG